MSYSLLTFPKNLMKVSNMKPSKSLQFIAGCAMIYFVWQLASHGWFDRVPALFNSNDKGLSGGASDLLLDVLPYLVNTVCLFGTIAIAVYGLMLKAIKPLGLKLLRVLDAKLEEMGIDLIEFSDESPEVDVEEPKELDINALEEALNGISKRLAKLEGEK